MRRPARLERAGALTPRDQMWAAIRRFGVMQDFSIAEIVLLSGQAEDTVLPYFQGLTAAGYLRQTEQKRPMVEPRRMFNRYALARDVGVEAPRVDREGKPVTQGLGRQQIWNVVRKFKGTFSRADVLLSCTTPVADQEAKYYLRHLALAGYLRVVTKGSGRGAGGTQSTYEFIRSRDTGPRAPIITRDKSVMDANTGKLITQQGKTHGEQRGHFAGGGTQ